MPRPCLRVAVGVALLAATVSPACTPRPVVDGPWAYDSGASSTDSGTSGDSGRDSGPGHDSGHDSTPGDTGPGPTTDVRIIVEPSDDGSALIAAIKAAQTSVHMTMYILSDDDIISALEAAHTAGADVRVVLDAKETTYNTTSYNALKAKGIGVVWSSPSYYYTHQKTVIIDGGTAWIMSMNASYSGMTSDRDYLAVDTEPDDVADAERVFAADYAGSALTSYDGALVLSPVNSKTRLLGLIEAATSTIDIEDEEYSDSDVTTALIARARAGVAVRLVLSDSTPDSYETAAVGQLEAAGVSVVVTSSPYIHAKAIVVDKATAYVGSANLTYTSLEKNRELGVIFDATAGVTAVSDTIATDFGNGGPF